MIYLAPLQGFTDYVYRKAYAQVFRGIDEFLIPYVTEKAGDIPAKYMKEVFPENNCDVKVVPQVLAANEDEFLFLVRKLYALGYRSFNLNMGCPYPMVIKRGRGAALLSDPERLERMFEAYFGEFSCPLSVKIRVGLNQPEEFLLLPEVLNRFPMEYVALHPRTAKQLYSGALHLGHVNEFRTKLNAALVLNGDIFTQSDFEERQNRFPDIHRWMLGRGVLMNPFLPDELTGYSPDRVQRMERLSRFHHLVYEGYLEAMDNEGNALNKLKQFWSYFCYAFPESRKVWKKIKKVKSMPVYLQIVNTVLLS